MTCLTLIGYAIGKVVVQLVEWLQPRDGASWQTFLTTFCPSTYMKHWWRTDGSLRLVRIHGRNPLDLCLALVEVEALYRLSAISGCTHMISLDSVVRGTKPLHCWLSWSKFALFQISELLFRWWQQVSTWIVQTRGAPYSLLPFLLCALGEHDGVDQHLDLILEIVVIFLRIPTILWNMQYLESLVRPVFFQT